MYGLGRVEMVHGWSLDRKDLGLRLKALALVGGVHVYAYFHVG